MSPIDTKTIDGLQKFRNHKYVRFQPKEWLDKNGYRDHDGDYWESKEIEEIWELSEAGEDPEIYSRWVISYDAGQICPTSDYENINPSWAVLEYITPEKYPEYFL